MKKKYVVTIAPPTPNGDLHVGHLSGPYLAADVYARARRQAGDEAVLVSYSDDYQSYMVRRARERGMDPLELARKNGLEIASTLALAGIELDHFMLASASDTFRDSVTLFAHAARDAGALVHAVRPSPYCEACHVYGYEAFGRGLCAVCGTSTDASQCEHCAHAPDVTGVRDVACILCRAPMVMRDVERLCLDLGRYRSFLRELYARTDKRSQLAPYLSDVLAQPDLRWPIDRPGEHGIDVEGFGRIHTWFSGIAGYHAALTQCCDKHTRLGSAERLLSDPETELVHFLGFDCSFSHAVVYPVLLHATGRFTTRVRWFTNAFLKLDGQDFSTSRGHAVWVRELLRESTVDAARMYTALVSPENAPANFERSDFRRYCAEEFGWVERMARGELELLPAAPGSLPVELQTQLSEVGAAWSQATSPEHFSMREMASAVDRLRRVALGHARAGGRHVRTLLAAYADMAEPIHPDLSHKLSAQCAQPPQRNVHAFGAEAE